MLHFIWKRKSHYFTSQTCSGSFCIQEGCVFSEVKWVMAYRKSFAFPAFGFPWPIFPSSCCLPPSCRYFFSPRAAGRSVGGRGAARGAGPPPDCPFSTAGAVPSAPLAGRPELSLQHRRSCPFSTPRGPAGRSCPFSTAPLPAPSFGRCGRRWLSILDAF